LPALTATQFLTTPRVGVNDDVVSITIDRLITSHVSVNLPLS
jgi:hypothetical protein